MKPWNVHRTTANELEDMLNGHALKGYRVHSIRGYGPNLIVVFVNEELCDQTIKQGRKSARAAAAASSQSVAAPSPQPESLQESLP